MYFFPCTQRRVWIHSGHDLRTKGQAAGKHALIRGEAFFGHQLVLQKNRKIQVNDGGECVERHKGAHHEKGALGGSDLGGGSRGHSGPINVLDLLLMPAQGGNHEPTGPSSESQAQNIMGGYQYHIW